MLCRGGVGIRMLDRTLVGRGVHACTDKMQYYNIDGVIAPSILAEKKNFDLMCRAPGSDPSTHLFPVDVWVHDINDCAPHCIFGA